MFSLPEVALNPNFILPIPPKLPGTPVGFVLRETQNSGDHQRGLRPPPQL